MREKKERRLYGVRDEEQEKEKKERRLYGVRDEEQEKEKKERRLYGVREEEQEKSVIIRNGDSAIESKISQENCRAPSR